MPFCTECGTENPPAAKFCFSCGTAMAQAPAPPAAPSEERKLITAIFVDLVGSTARSEQLDPEDVRALVAPYHARVRGELEGHGGTFEKFSGDAILALFGTPKAHEDDPERAVRAALAVGRGIAELNAEDEWLDLHIRIGIHTGEALVMLGARPREGEWSAAGDVLNTAARIQSAAPVDGILVSRRPIVATNGAFEFEEAEPIAGERQERSRSRSGRSRRAGRGGAGPRRETRRSSAGRRSSPSSPLLRRAASRSAGAGLGDDRRRAGHRQEPPAARARAAPRGAVDVHWGRCLSYGEGITYWPVAEIFKSAAGILQSDDRETIAAEARRVPRDAPDRRSRRAANDRLRALQPDRHPDDAARNVRHERDLAGRAPLGDPPRAAAARGRAGRPRSSSRICTGPSRRCSS